MRGLWVTVGEGRFIYHQRQGREAAAEQIATPGERKRCSERTREKREDDRQTEGTRGDRRTKKEDSWERDKAKRDVNGNRDRWGDKTQRRFTSEEQVKHSHSYPPICVNICVWMCMSRSRLLTACVCLTKETGFELGYASISQRDRKKIRATYRLMDVKYYSLYAMEGLSQYLQYILFFKKSNFS